LNRTKNRTPDDMLSNNGFCLCSISAVHVTIFSNGSKFHPVSNFTGLHALTLAAHSYALLFLVHHALSITSLTHFYSNQWRRHTGSSTYKNTYFVL